jgi:phosphomannomutase
MVTSSHNPWNWNGVKFKGKFGGSATPAIMKKVEDELGSAPPSAAQAAAIEEVDLKQAHVEAMCKFADLELIAKSGFKFAVDSMYGSGRGVLTGIFGKWSIPHVAIRQEVNPLFPGINPEPIEPHIELLRKTVLKEN